MAYFPAFVKLDGVRVLIVGGGKIATDKLRHMLDFTTDIVVLAPHLSSQMYKLISEYHLEYLHDYYKANDMDGFGIVVVAVDDVNIQKALYLEAKQKGILCNAVDSVDYCDFIFPSYLKKGDLTIAISTSGASPAVAKQLRHFLEKIIPDTIVGFLEEMKSFRKTMPKGKARMVFLEQKAKNYFQKLQSK